MFRTGDQLAARVERYFPTTDRLASRGLVLVEVVETRGGLVCALYEYELKNGGRYRNTEVHAVHGEQIHEVTSSSADRSMVAETYTLDKIRRGASWQSRRRSVTTRPMPAGTGPGGAAETVRRVSGVWR